MVTAALTMLRSMVRLHPAPPCSSPCAVRCSLSGRRRCSRPWCADAPEAASDRWAVGGASFRGRTSVDRLRLMDVVVLGAGAVGARAARQLVGIEGVTSLVVVDTRPGAAEGAASSLGSPARAGRWPDGADGGAHVVVLAAPGDHVALARIALAQGAHVVSVADDLATVRALQAVDDEARSAGRSVVVGAGFSPGLSCVLARHAGAGLDTVDEIHVARAGTGGPACARRHHQARREPALDWRDGEWSERAAGSGRELCWFPDPIGGRDCYRAGLADAALLVPAFPGVARVTARMASSRRDRLTARLPMLRRPHEEGLLGAIRVEVRGRRGPVPDVRVLGVLDRPALVAGAVAGVVAAWAGQGRLARTGAGGLAELVPEPLGFLQELARLGVRAAAFDGAGPAAPLSSPG